MLNRGETRVLPLGVLDIVIPHALPIKFKRACIGQKSLRPEPTLTNFERCTLC